MSESTTVRACPACDSTDIYARSNQPGWYCKGCQTAVPEPVERERRHEAARPGGTPARTLEEMTIEEFDALVTGDGSDQTGESASTTAAATEGGDD